MLTVIEDFFHKPYCVYAHYSDEELIYIGSGELGRATNINSRSVAHRDALSHGVVKVVIMDRFESVADAREIEARLIKSCRPTMNYAHNRGFEKPVTRYEHATTTRIAVLMEVLVEAIRSGSSSPTNEYLSFVCDCSVSNITRMIKKLVNDGYLTCENEGTPNRVFGFGSSEFVVSDLVKETTTRTRFRKQTQQIYDVLTRVAETGEPCPSNADLAAITGSKPAQPGKIIAGLKKKGILTVEMVGNNRRIIHINGYSTSPTVDHNIKGVATTERATRVRDYIRV